MTKILFINGDDEYDAMHIENEYGYNQAAKMTTEAGGTLRIDDDENAICADLTIEEFGEVDPNFILFMLNNFVDEDMSKSRDIFVIKEDE